MTRKEQIEKASEECSRGRKACDLIIDRLEAKLAIAVEALKYYRDNLKGLTVKGDIPAIEALAKIEGMR